MKRLHKWIDESFELEASIERDGKRSVFRIGGVDLLFALCLLSLVF